jgi:hypothetical protein
MKPKRLSLRPHAPARACFAALARRGLLGAVLAGMAAAPLAQPADGPAALSAPRHSCTAWPAVQVHAVQAADVETVCEGAARAWQFMSALRLGLPAQTLVDVVDRLPGDLDGRALGCFDPDSRRVLLLSRAAFDATGGWFGQPPADQQPGLHRRPVAVCRRCLAPLPGPP